VHDPELERDHDALIHLVVEADEPREYVAKAGAVVTAPAMKKRTRARRGSSYGSRSASRSIFRERVVARFVDKHAISQELAKRLMTWRHPGFSG
jgi:hypothetical protein